MISDFFIDAGAGLVGWFFSWFPTGWKLPDWVTSMMTYVAQFVNNAVNLGVWIPWAIIFTVTSAVLAFWLVGMAIRALRWLLGLIPTMGGGA